MRTAAAINIKHFVDKQFFLAGFASTTSNYPFTMRGWMYILECIDGSYYIGSTKNLKRRLKQHQNGEGANHTKKRLPVKLVYFEEYPRIDTAFYREKQVQGWNRKKKEALIYGKFGMLPGLSGRKTVALSASATLIDQRVISCTTR